VLCMCALAQGQGTFFFCTLFFKRRLASKGEA
jgi:hypothetical protein